MILMLSTTYSKFTELQITLPSADASAMKTRPKELVVSVSDEGAYKLNGAPLYGNDQNALLEAMTKAAGGASDTVLVIQADASARHQSVVSVMEAARRAGLNQITFATQASERGDKIKAEKCYEKSQYWLDRANKARGWN